MSRINHGSQLLESLEPNMRNALGHPWRREILRVLHTSQRSRTIGDLTNALPPISTAQISYHLQALRDCEAVEGEGMSFIAGRHCVYSSLVGGDAEVLAVLREREQSDRGQRQAAAARHSSRYLKMFHVPQPTRSIRLGARRNRPEPQA